MKKKRNQKGFTLIELLVVIAIIGILAVVAVPALFKNINKAKVADVEADYNAFKSASLSYYTDENTMPTETNQLKTFMDNVPSECALGGNYTLTFDQADKELKLSAPNAKLTTEQADKLKKDLGNENVDTTSGLTLTLINNTNL